MSKKPVEPPNFDGWLTKAEAARFLTVAEKTIDRLAERGEIQKATRKRPPGLSGPPACVFHPEDLNRIKAEHDKAAAQQQSFVMPSRNGGELAVAAQSPAMALAPIVAAIRMAGPAELKEPYSLTLKQAREVSGLPGSYIHEHFVKTGRAVKTGRGWRIARAELETFCRHLSNMSKEAVAHV